MLFFHAVNFIVRVFKVLSTALLGAILLVTCAEVVGRMLGRPILGAVELGILMAALVLGFSLPYAHKEKAHVRVNILFSRLGEKAQECVAVVTNGIGSALFIVISWQMWVYGGQMKESGEVSMTLQIPTFHVIHLIALAMSVLALVQCGEVVGALRKALKS